MQNTGLTDITVLRRQRNCIMVEGSAAWTYGGRVGPTVATMDKVSSMFDLRSYIFITDRTML
jgi:hypothetical protein